MYKKLLKTINELIKKFPNNYKFYNNDINKFILLLKKVFILMNTWIVGKNLIKHPGKEAFYSELNLEDINDEDYINAQKVFEESKIKDLVEYHDLYV